MTTINFSAGAGQEIAQLCDRYGSDKSTATGDSKFTGGWDYHDYAPVYQMMFSPIRNSVKAVLEVGLGTNNPDLPSSMGIEGRPGASLRVWKDYFPNTVVVGVDIDKDVLFSEENIQTFFCDQTDQSSIELFFTQCPTKRFDVIIDDGLHTEIAAATFFENAFNRLRPGGLYFIEDAWWCNGEDVSFLKNANIPYIVFGDTFHNRLIMVSR